jgi:hypothetical protein
LIPLTEAHVEEPLLERRGFFFAERRALCGARANRELG